MQQPVDYETGGIPDDEGFAAQVGQQPGDSCQPCELLLAKVREGNLGRKTGQGFFDYGKVAS